MAPVAVTMAFAKLTTSSMLAFVVILMATETFQSAILPGRAVRAERKNSEAKRASLRSVQTL